MTWWRREPLTIDDYAMMARTDDDAMTMLFSPLFSPADLSLDDYSSSMGTSDNLLSTRTNGASHDDDFSSDKLRSSPTFYVVSLWFLSFALFGVISQCFSLFCLSSLRFLFPYLFSRLYFSKFCSLVALVYWLLLLFINCYCCALLIGAIGVVSLLLY